MAVRSMITTMPLDTPVALYAQSGAKANACWLLVGQVVRTRNDLVATFDKHATVCAPAWQHCLGDRPAERRHTNQKRFGVMVGRRVEPIGVGSLSDAVTDCSLSSGMPLDTPVDLYALSGTKAKPCWRRVGQVVRTRNDLVPKFDKHEAECPSLWKHCLAGRPTERTIDDDIRFGITVSTGVEAIVSGRLSPAVVDKSREAWAQSATGEEWKREEDRAQFARSGMAGGGPRRPRTLWVA